jgi:hypothetical protein
MFYCLTGQNGPISVALGIPITVKQSLILATAFLLNELGLQTSSMVGKRPGGLVWT